MSITSKIFLYYLYYAKKQIVSLVSPGIRHARQRSQDAFLCTRKRAPAANSIAAGGHWRLVSMHAAYRPRRRVRHTMS
jgi:hypothetical protein